MQLIGLWISQERFDGKRFLSEKISSDGHRLEQRREKTGNAR
jgi:hypothetical protein